jgi:hypothetical protein
MLHLFIIPHVQTQSNRVCNSYAILLWLMLPRHHFVSRILYFTTAGFKCRVAGVKSCPVLHFSVVIFSMSFEIIDTNTIKCWELSTAQAGARGREGCCTYSLSLMFRLNQTESAILMLFCCDKCFRGITLFQEFRIVVLLKVRSSFFVSMSLKLFHSMTFDLR